LISEPGLNSKNFVTANMKMIIQQFRHPLFVNSLFILSNQLLFACVGLVFWLLATHWYTPENVGIGSATISAMTLLTYLGLLGMDYSIVRFLPNARTNGRSLINSSLALGGIVSAFAALIFIIGLRQWSPSLLFLQEKPIYAGIFIICTVCWTCYYIATRTCIGKRRSGYSLAQGAVFNFVRLVLIMSLANVFLRFNIYLSWGVAGIAATLTCVFFFIPRIQPDYRFSPEIK
jgi:O-antigen/teichoic acid export membrane protein